MDHVSAHSYFSYAVDGLACWKYIVYPNFPKGHRKWRKGSHVTRHPSHKIVNLKGLPNMNQNYLLCHGLGGRFDWMQAGDLAVSLAQNSPLQLTNRERIKVCRDVANALLFW